MDIIDFKYLLERLNYAPPGSTSSSYDNYGSQELISMLAQLENENKVSNTYNRYNLFDVFILNIKIFCRLCLRMKKL
jgi:hypothetical protein